MDIVYLFLFVAFCANCLGYNHTRIQNRLSLVRDLMANISTDIRPGIDLDELLVVNTSLELMHLTELNEVKGYISIVGYFCILWIDNRITWDPANYGGIESITLNAEKVWVPHLVIANGVENVSPLTAMPSKVVFNNHGLAIWNPVSVMKTLCYMEIPAYPFDVHGCHVEIVPYGGLTAEIVFNTNKFTVGTKHYRKHTTWELTNTYADYELPDEISDFPLAYYEFQFKRKSSFQVVYFVIPVAVLSVLNPVVFLLPIQSGERVSVSISTLLSFVMFQNVIGKLIPKTSSPMPYLCLYLLMTSLISGLITIFVILSQRLRHCYGEKSVPKWLYRFLSVSDRNRNKRSGCLTNGETSTAVIHEKVLWPKEVTWVHAMNILDKFIFLIFLVNAILCFISYLFLAVHEQNRRIAGWMGVQYLPY